MPFTEQGFTVGFVQVPELNIHEAGRLDHVTFIVYRLDANNQCINFAVFVVVVEARIPVDLYLIDSIEIFRLNFLR